MAFISPSANSLQYLRTYTGSTISFGIASVFGVIFGAFISSVFSRNGDSVAQRFHLITFEGRRDMIRHLVGAVLMGVGAVMALGCTIGQGIGGISTLAVSSIVALIAIMVGGTLTFPLRKKLFNI